MTDYPNWFEMNAKPNFEKHLESYAGDIRLRFLQLGAFTGDASVWLCENILTQQSSTLNDVDTWEGSNEEMHKAMDFSDVYSTYIEKTKKFSNIYHYQAKTFNFLIKQYEAKDNVPCYDFIYIDADHTTVGVLMDAELSWPLLKAGGIMAFDDYTWGHELPTELAPTLGIDLFLARHEKEYEVLVINSQVWIRKNDN
jgi:hypothetical protein